MKSKLLLLAIVSLFVLAPFANAKGAGHAAAHSGKAKSTHTHVAKPHKAKAPKVKKSPKF